MCAATKNLTVRLYQGQKREHLVGQLFPFNFSLMFTETQEKNLTMGGKNLVTSMELFLQVPMVSLPEKQITTKIKPKPFEVSVSCDTTQQQMFQHKHVYQISAYISSPKVST